MDVLQLMPAGRERSGTESALVIDGKALLHALKEDLSPAFMEVCYLHLTIVDFRVSGTVREGCG
jgi:hypothetical protein